MEEFINKIISAEVVRDVNNWWWEMRIEATEVPTGVDFIYTSKKGEGFTAYFGTCGEWVSSFIHDPARQTGFGGGSFSLRMEDQMISIKGPWTGRPSVYMEMGFTPYMEAVVTSHKRTIYGITEEGVNQILNKFHLPFVAQCGKEWEFSEEDSLILVPTEKVEGRIDKSMKFSGIPFL